MHRSLTTADRRWLQERFGPALRFDEPMSRHTWIRIGGPAEAFVTPEHTGDLLDLVRGCRERGLPLLPIGGGTNLLVGDAGLPGVVVSPARCLDRIQAPEIDGRAVRLPVMAAVKLPALVRHTAEHGWRGLTFAAGIPGSVGGAAVMNAGTRQGCMAEVVERIEVLTGDGSTVAADRQYLDFGYRCLSWNRVFAGPAIPPQIVIRVEFRLAADRKESLKAEIARYLAQRNRSQPTRLPSAGCFFKNPSADQPAGQLIDRAGLKGMRIGGAQVSERHANFIVNRGGASAADVIELMERIRETVFDRFRIKLEPEVIFVGQQTHPQKPVP
jgi:UDP-N-acetylmuramate dehydrogenase